MFWSLFFVCNFTSGHTQGLSIQRRGFKVKIGNRPYSTRGPKIVSLGVVKGSLEDREVGGWCRLFLWKNILLLLFFFLVFGFFNELE